jgi:transcriptional regulator with XRE-family HTH domain
MGVSASQLSLVEAGKRQPSLRVVNALASTVHVPAALISLLASAPGEVEAKSNEDISDLSRVLLRLLVSAKEEPQRMLTFKE